MNSVMTFINDAGIVGWLIMLLGLGSFAIIIERTSVLYFRYGMNIEDFWTKVQTLVLAHSLK